MKTQSVALSASLVITVVILALTPSSRLAAQNSATKEHHHYKVIDIGTFGGPSSYINEGGDQGFFPGPIGNNAGAFTGWADMSTPDPYAPLCFNGDCQVSHAFQWRNGVRRDLGVLHGGSSSATTWISANALIAGTSQNGQIDPLPGEINGELVAGFPENRAVLWLDGKIIDLKTLPEGGYESGSVAVNDRGQVTGWAINTIPDPISMSMISNVFFPYEAPFPYETRAFLWQDGVMKDLGTLGGPDSFPTGINEFGQVIGISYTSFAANSNNGCSQFAPPDTPTQAQDPFLWDKHGGMIDLGTFGGTCGYAAGINNRGQVVGASNLAGDQAERAFIWDPAAGLVNLGTLGGDFSYASAINDQGIVVGVSTLSGDTQINAVLWGKNGIVDLGALPGDNCANPFWINASGQVVGHGGTNCEGRGFLSENSGALIDLNTLIASDDGFSITDATYINDRGEIIGQGLPTGCTDADTCGHTYVLIPCDENHPNIEGCDYSGVDAATAEIRTRSDSIRRETSLASPALEPTETSTEIQRSLGGANSPINQMFRRRFGFARSLRTPQASALTTTSTTAGLRITSGPPPSGTVGRAYDFRCAQIPPCNVFEAGYSLTAAGGVPPYSMHWAGAPGSSVPPGLGVFAAPNFLCINVKLPAICGKPTVAGTYHVIVTVADSSSPRLHASATYSITIFQ